jgi:hypothetical protein
MMVSMEAKTIDPWKTRNPHAAASKQRSKKIADRRQRRAKDSKKSWKNEEHT